MNPTRIIGCSALCLQILAGQGIADPTLTPRNDINPAVLYLQAFEAYPELSKSEARMLNNPDKASLEKLTRLVAKFSRSIELLERAVQSKVACDWGIDLADGPSAFVPSVAHMRTALAASMLRARVALASGQTETAVSALLAPLVMLRHAAAQGPLVTTMMQLQAEVTVPNFISEHMHRFDAASLLRLEHELSGAPPRTSIAQAMEVEKTCFFGWFNGQIRQTRSAHSGNDRAALHELDKIWSGLFSEVSFSKISAVAGHTTEGLLRYFKEAEMMVDQFTRFANAGPEDVATTGGQFSERVNGCENLIVLCVLPNLERARRKELEALARWEMLRAGIAYKLRGERGLEEVPDPFGPGPFACRRNSAGFELHSRLVDYGFSGTLAFGE